MPTVTVGGVGWSVVSFFFCTAPYFSLRLYRRRRTAVLTIAPTVPQPPPARHNHHMKTTTSAATPAAAELSPPPAILCLSITPHNVLVEAILGDNNTIPTWMMVNRTAPHLFFYPRTQVMMSLSLSPVTVPR